MNADDQDETQRAEIASKGGQARAAKLTPEKRSTIAKEAAQKRWAEAKHDAAEVSSHRVLESFKSVLDPCRYAASLRDCAGPRRHYPGAIGNRHHECDFGKP